MKRLLNLFRRAERVASVAPYVPSGSDKAKSGQVAASQKAPPALKEVVALSLENEAKLNLGPLPPITHPDRFPACLAIVLKHEGGYVNHPKDPGGRTNLGVTQRVWEAWTGKPATEQEMRSLTPAMVGPLYRRKYWDKVRAPDLAPGLDLHVFDFGVNAGPARAIRYLQMMVGANPDGAFGPATMRALSNYLDQYGTAAAIRRYGELREQYYRQLRTFPTFGRGWLRRNREVTAAALEMKA